MDYTILVIDYEPRGIDGVRAPLAKAGFRVEVAANGEAGVEAFERLRPALTFIEVMLPRRTGLEVCMQLKKTPHGSRAPIVVMTSRYRSRKYRGEARRCGADDFIEKPVEEQVLIQLVERLLEAAGGHGSPGPKKEASGSVDSRPTAPSDAPTE
jgi:DNA-binding response OmpR family regulator